MGKIYFLLLVLVLSSSTVMGQTAPSPPPPNTCPPGPPPSPHDGNTDGTLLPNGERQFNFQYAQLGGFDCFEQFREWFPQNLNSTNAISPNHLVLDMAYTTIGTATFLNVQVPATDNYNMVVRYAFEFGLFPGVTDRPEGVKANGVVITYNMHFPITYSFEDYEYSSLVVPLHAGKNTIQFFNVTNHGVPRLDTMAITGKTAAICSDAPTLPGALSAAAAMQGTKLSWTASTWPKDCSVTSYDVYRGTKSGFIPSDSNRIVSGVKTNTYNDTTAVCSSTYYYLVQAVDTAGAAASGELRVARCSTMIEGQYEVESPAVFNASKSSGPVYRIFSWSNFSDGQGTVLDATAAGQSVTIILNVPVAGVYDIRYATKAYANRGIVQLKVAGANVVGPAEDLYSSSEVLKVFDLGTVSLLACKVPFVFTSVSKNAASAGFTQAFDYITLTKQ
jgi:hypothetical protein